MPVRVHSLIATLVALTSFGGSAAAAHAEVNFTGTWSGEYHCRTGSCAGETKTGVFVLVQAKGSSTVSGTLNLTGGGEGPVTGSVSGGTLTLSGRGSTGYEAKGVETISASGLSFSGSYEDNAGTSGELTATRPSLPVFSSTLRAAAIQVLCNYQVSTSDFQCTASVADASGESPAQIPTGAVDFSTSSGGFTPTGSCTLVATPGSSDTASCSVTYKPATKIATGTPAPVTGAYVGDGTFAPSAAKSGAGAVVSPIVTAAKSTGEGAKTTVTCPSGTTSCSATVTLSVEELGSGAVAASKKAKRRTITIGRTAVTVKAGASRAVSVSLNSTGKKLLSRHKHFVALLKVVSGGVAVKTEKIQIKTKKR